MVIAFDIIKRRQGGKILLELGGYKMSDAGTVILVAIFIILSVLTYLFIGYELMW